MNPLNNSNSIGNSTKKAKRTQPRIEKTPLPERIDNILITKGITKEVLAEHIGVSPAYLTRVMNGKRRPSKLFFKMLSVLEGRPFKWFLRSRLRNKSMRIKRKAELARRAKDNARFADDNRPYDPTATADGLEECERCQGDGLIGGRLCPDCRGEGVYASKESKS